MLRIGKMTDYAFVLLSYFSKEEMGKAFNARDLSRISQLPLPTVSKILKILARGKLLTSQRGANGGYRLAKTSGQITVAEVITCLEGPISLTECSLTQPSTCDFEPKCVNNNAWWKINQIVARSLNNLTIEDMNSSDPRIEEIMTGMVPRPNTTENAPTPAASATESTGVNEQAYGI